MLEMWIPVCPAWSRSFTAGAAVPGSFWVSGSSPQAWPGCRAEMVGLLVSCGAGSWSGGLVPGLAPTPCESRLRVCFSFLAGICLLPGSRLHLLFSAFFCAAAQRPQGVRCALGPSLLCAWGLEFVSTLWHLGLFLHFYPTVFFQSWTM